LIVNIRRIGAHAAIVSTIALGAVGLSAGVASADQPLPSTPGMTWKLDRGHGHHGDWDWDGGDWDGGRWNGGWNGGYYGAPCGVGAWVPPAVAQWVPPAAWGC
jgi:hypothetical protein